MLNKPRVKYAEESQTEEHDGQDKEPDDPAWLDSSHQLVYGCLMIMLLKMYGIPDYEYELKCVQSHEGE